MILTVCQHHSLAVARGAAGIENVAEVIVVCLRTERVHFRLPRTVLAQLDEIVEIHGAGILRTYPHAIVKDDDALQRRAQRRHAVSLVILLLLADKQETHLRIGYHVLYLLLTARGIERYRDGTYAVCTEIGEHVVYGVLREYGNVLLNLNAKVQHCV